MRNIVIVGNSWAGLKSAEKIRQKDTESKITILTKDANYPFDGEQLLEIVRNRESLPDISVHVKEFCQDKKIEVIFEKGVSRINLQRKRIFCEDKTQIEYDVLILTEGGKSLFPAIKGTNKDGVLGFSRWEDAKMIAQTLPLIDAVMIQSDTVYGIQLASAVAEAGKEAILVSSGKNLFSRNLPSQWLEVVFGWFEEKGLRFVEGNEVSEILGDSVVKAARLKSEKVIACQLVVFAEAREDLRAFQDLKNEDTGFVDTNAQLGTTVDGVFALDLLTDPSGCSEMIWGRKRQLLERQGSLVAAQLTDVIFEEKSETLYCSFGLDQMTITIIGDLVLDQYSESLSWLNLEKKSFKAVYADGGCIKGALLINQEEAKEEVLKLIQSKESIAEVKENVLESSDTSI